MQYSFPLAFNLQGTAGEKFTKFCSTCNLVLPSQTAGAHITAKPENNHHLSIKIPKLKKSCTFSVADVSECITHHVVLYNLGCSLNSCLLIHSLDESQKHLLITIVTDSKEDYNLLMSVHNRLSRVK